MYITRPRRPSAAIVISIAALFTSLAGTAIAAGGLISGSKLRNRSVAAIKLKAHTITGHEVDMATLGTVPSAVTAQNASHAANANHAVNADAAVSAQAADSASTFGGLTATQYLHADVYTGAQATPHYNSGLGATTGSLSTPAIAPGSYLVIAHGKLGAGAVGAQFSCTFGSAAAGIDDDVNVKLAAGQTYDFPLMVSFTSSTAGPVTLSCEAAADTLFTMTAYIAVIRLGSENHDGQLTAG